MQNFVINNSYRYNCATLIRFNTSNSVYNTDGLSCSNAECINALKSIWDTAIWDLDGDWPSFKQL